MGNDNNMVDATQLREWLDCGEPVFVLDIRPSSERREWQIPGSHHLDAYQRLKEGDPSVLNNIEIPKDKKVVTVCAAGKTSQIAADVLRNKGVDAYSLEGGMKAWSTAWNVASKVYDDFNLFQIRRTGKGCLSYVLASNGEAIIIDASLPVEVYVQQVKQLKLSVKYVIETHIHADHLSRSKEVAAYFNVPLFLPVPNKVQFPFSSISPEAVFNVGNIVLRTLSMPGHTLESVGFYIENKVLFTGDTLFTDGVGRPDLKSSEEETRNKAALLHASLKRMLTLPANVMVLPAHTNKPVAFDGKIIATTVGDAKNNIPLLTSNEDKFVDYLLQRIPPTPANYLTIVEKNIAGDFTHAEAAELEAGANRCAIS